MTKNTLIIVSAIILVFMASCGEKGDEVSIKKIDSLIEQAKISELSNIEKMKTLSDSIGVLSEEIDYQNGLAYYHFFEAKYLRSQMEIAKALNTLVVALKEFRECNNKIGEGLTVNEILMDVKFTEEKEFPQLPDYGEDTSSIVKLIKIEYQVHIPIELSNRDNLDSLPIFVTLIDSISKISPENEYEKMKQNHLLAKINYAIGRIYRKAYDLDSSLFYFKKSVHYDTLLHSRQPWSIFTVAEVYLEMFKKDTNNVQLLDSIQKYNYLSLYVLNKYIHFEHDSTYFVNSDTMYKVFKKIVNKGFYNRQLASIGKNILEYEILAQKNDINILNYNSKSDSLFQTVTAVSSNYYMLQRNKEKKEKTNFKIIVILLVIIVLISVFVVYTSKKQNYKITKLSKKSEAIKNQLSEEKKNLEKLNIELIKEKNKLKKLNERLEKEKITVEVKNKNLQFGNIVAESISHSVARISRIANNLQSSNNLDYFKNIKPIFVHIPYVEEAHAFFLKYKYNQYKQVNPYNIIIVLSDLETLISFSDIKIELITEYNSQFKVRVNGTILRQAIYNILHNSVKEFQKRNVKNLLIENNVSPIIIIRTYREKDFFILEIEDNAGGINKILLEQINNYSADGVKSSGLFLIQEFCKYLDIEYEYIIKKYNKNLQGTIVKLYFK